MLRVLASTWGVWPGILFASAAFGAAHRRPGRTRDIVIHVFTGLILGVLAWLTGGWLASAAAHAAYNCVVVEWRPQAMITREPGAPSISHNRVMSPGRAGDWS
jgi:membrane protease YdiL (CAAX protease family)